jgi:AcrR family transcriptional regulator
MGIKERREREKDQTRTRIMDAARELFASEGYEAVSMRRIAQEIEYSPTAIYVHFADKQELFREICSEDFARLATVFAKLAKIEDPLEQICQIGQEYIRFALEYPNHYRLMFMTRHVHEPGEALPESKGNPDEDAYAFLKMAVQRGISAGLFRRDLEDASLITQTLWAVAHGVASLQIVKGNDPWIEWAAIELRAKTALQAVVAGMRADAAPAKKPATTRKAASR